jgi:BirA family transcriptional regulator, biotin operon repressor / biotin---[acetyl-CoA-carboxylase] ligase
MKNRILTLLYEHNGTYLSGQQISDQLGISRTAVWKHIKNLIKDGYDIESAHNRGYRLIRHRTHLLPGEIREHLSTDWLGKSVTCLDSVDSTNQWAKRKMHELAHGSLIIAEEQTAGKGRLGRTWTSAKGEGLWISLVLRPDLPMAEGVKMTQMAAAAMQKAISRITDLKVLIKWPNDLMINDKKCVES